MNMKRMAREVLVEFLKRSEPKRAPLHEVEVQLVNQGVLGFGVQPIDVVHAAARDNVVSFDPKNQEITLLDM